MYVRLYCCKEGFRVKKKERNGVAFRTNKECAGIKEVSKTNKECTDKYLLALSLPNLNDVKRTRSCRQLCLKGS